MIVLYSRSKRKAELWAWRFAWARRCSGLAPLTVVRVDGHWGVDNPDYREDLYEIDARGRVARKVRATTPDRVDTSSFTTGPGRGHQPRPGQTQGPRLREDTPEGYRAASALEAPA